MSQTEVPYTCIAPGIVRRTDRGLCLVGTRITLYLIMDYLRAGWPPHLIRHWLDLSEAQIEQALQYIDTHRPGFEAEYAEVVGQAQARERFWRERQRQRQAQAVDRPTSPVQALALERLKALQHEGKL